MFKKILLAISLLFLIACDDGDFDVPNFVFSTHVEDCGNLILFNINADKSEALIINLNEDNEANKFFNTPMDNTSFELNNSIAYRIFNDDVSSNYFCRDIPPISPSIQEEWVGNATLIVNNDVSFDDKDSVEELDETLNTDANFTPSDEIPDYYDMDDDNDGIKTSDELVAVGTNIADLIDADGDNTLDYLDTHADGIFDYLDSDDDNDGIPTLNESLLSDSNDNGIKDYLDADYAVLNVARPQIENKYTLSYVATFILENLSLNNANGNTINYENYEYGVKTGSVLITN